jgi:hypothetical protein
MTMPFAGPDVTAHPEALPYNRIMPVILLLSTPIGEAATS